MVNSEFPAETANAYRILFEQSGEAIALIDPATGRILEVNRSASKLLGFTREELQSMNIADLDVTAPSERLLEHARSVVTKGNEVFETKKRCRNGAIIDVEVSVNSVPYNGTIALQAVWTDITERKKLLRTLDEARVHLEEAQEYAKLGSWMLHPNLQRGTWSKEMYRLFGINSQAGVPPLNDFLELMHPDHRTNVLALHNRLMETGESFETEYMTNPAKGPVRWLAVKAKSIKGADGRIAYLTGICQDITDRKKTENELRMEQNRLLKLAATVPGAICTFKRHPDGRYSVPWASPQIFDITGFQLQELHENADCIAARLHPMEIADIGTAIVKSAKNLTPYRREFQFRHPSKGEIWLEVHSVPVSDEDGGTLWHGTCTDITEKRKFLEASQRADKLDSIGILAGGIAHDFNNLLTGIYGYLDLFRDGLKDSDSVGYLDKITSTMNRAKALTLQLLTFSKGGAPIRKTAILEPTIRESVKFALSGTNVTAEFNVSENLKPCDCDQNQIGQVIDNLVINAVQAMPDGGKISVSAGNARLRSKEVGQIDEGDYVRISITDSGCGISGEILPKIFDPFFTTKQTGNGLGLATVYSIMKKHNGEITVSSEPGKGTTFQLYLPVARKDAVSLNTKQAVHHRGTGSVLVMDDEEYLRNVLGEMLSNMGYRVEYARNGDEALKMIASAESANHQFTAAILDLTIRGGLGGLATVIQLRKKYAEMTVFLTSGYSENEMLATPQKLGFNDYLVKPFTRNDVAVLFNKHFSSGL